MKFLKCACVILLLFLSSCDVIQYVSVPISYDPKLVLKPDSVTVLLINQFDISKTNFKSKRKIDVLKAGAYSSINYAKFQLAQLPHVNVINLVDSTALNVTADSVKTLTAKYHADYVLALKNFSANIGLDAVDNSTAYYSSNVAVNYVLYENNGIYFKKLDGAITDAQSDMPNMGLLASLIIHPTVGGNKGSITAGAEHATEVALQDYLPYTITYKRPLFNDDWLKPAVKEILAGAFDKAYNELTPYLKSTNPQIVSKASYNLAVVYEAQGDFDLAIQMAQQSLDKDKNQYAEALLNDLKTE